MRILASPSVIPANPAIVGNELEWRSRYDGLVMIAQIGGKAVAGISGPWSGKFALTWWDRPLPARQLELYDSMDAAQHEVQVWAKRMRTGGFSIAAAPPLRASASLRSVPCETTPARPDKRFLDRVRALMPRFVHARMPRPNSETIERLRRQQACSEADISDLHFGAIE